MTEPVPAEAITDRKRLFGRSLVVPPGPQNFHKPREVASTEPVPAEAITAALAAFNKAWLTRNQLKPQFAEKLVRDVLAAAAPAFRAAEKARIIAFVEQRAKDINGKGCGADVEELYALADLLRGES